MKLRNMVAVCVGASLLFVGSFVLISQIAGRDDVTPSKRFVAAPPAGEPPAIPDKEIIALPPVIKVGVVAPYTPKEVSKTDEAPPTSKLAFQALDIASKSDGIEIFPDKATISSVKRFQIITVKTDGKVKWMVFNKAKDPVEWLQLPGTKSIQIFPNYGVDDEITVYAYTAVNGDPTEPVKSTITATKDGTAKTPTGPVENPGDKPPTPKTDTPDAPAEATGTLHITIISDADLAGTNPGFVTLINSKDLKSGVENRGHKLWLMDQKKDVAKIKERGFDEYLRTIGKIPLYIIQDSAGIAVDSGPLPTTLISILGKVDAVNRKGVKPKAAPKDVSPKSE